MMRRQCKVILWIVALLVVSALATAGLLHQAKQFSSTYAKAEADKSVLVASAQKLEDKIHALEAEVAQHDEATQTLTADRDNILAQNTRLAQEKVDLESVTSLHERVLKRTAQENRTLKERLQPLEEEHTDLQEAHSALMSERMALQQELDQLAKEPMQKKLKAELDKEHAQHQKDLATLQETRKELGALKSEENRLKTELPQLQQRLGGLQDKYTKIMADNKTLAFKSTHVPKEVTTLAREHERLLKDMADTHYNLGLLFAKKEDFVRATKEFQKVIELRPDDADAHYNLGLIYAEHLPDRDRAMENFKRYLQINPRASDASWVKSYIASWKASDAKDNLE